jgi:hypothetical protein
MTAITPRSVFADRLMLDINGVQTADDRRHGFLTFNRANETLDLLKATLSNPMSGDQFYDGSEDLAKTVTLGTGLTYYDLRAPALNLFPTLTPLRNAIPRNQRKNPGDALRYKAITAINGSGYNWTPFVPEGKRAGRMTYSLVNKTLSYATIGEEDSITEEAMYASEGFEDENSMIQLRLMLKTMVKEEAGILAGNNSLALGTPGTPTLSASGSGATLPAATYSVIVVALTQLGYMQSTLGAGVATTQSVASADGSTFTLNGGASNKSTGATQAATLGQTLFATVAPVTGAVAYAWYVGTAGSETLQAITTINSATFAAPLAGSRQAATVIAADYSNNSGLAFDGLMTTAFLNAGTNSYFACLPSGTAGTGTPLTASGVGSVNEIDTMLKSMWDNYRISPTVIYVSSQELKSITKLVLSNASAPLLKYEAQADGGDGYRLTANGAVAFYFNPYTPDGGTKIPVKIHPNLAPGTILAWAEKLPAWYVSNETPLVAEMLTRKDYYTQMWPKVTRQQDYGVYAQEALAVYAPFAAGVITNIAPTP